MVVTWWIVAFFRAVKQVEAEPTTATASLLLVYFYTIHMYSKCPVDWREISMKQSVGKCKQINF